MPLLPVRVEQVLFDTQAPRLIRHVAAVPARTADGLVAEVYDQMRREFQLVPPVTLHAPVPDLLAGVWGMLRETVVAGPVDRSVREVVCEAVSQINQCAFCVDAHSALLAGASQGRVADLIHADRTDQISDPALRAAALWARANRTPGADELRRPPFAPEDAPEIIGAAVCFHYIDRMVSIFLADAPVPLPARLGWLRSTVIRVAGSTIGRRIMSVAVEPGRAVGALPEAAASPEFSWAQPTPAVADALGRLEAVIEAHGEEALPRPVRELVAERVAGWSGEHPGISRSWVDSAVEPLDRQHRPAGRLAMLAALAPYQVDASVIRDFGGDHPSAQKLITATAWASFAATRRTAGWLTP